MKNLNRCINLRSHFRVSPRFPDGGGCGGGRQDDPYVDANDDDVSFCEAKQSCQHQQLRAHFFPWK